MLVRNIALARWEKVMLVRNIELSMYILTWKSVRFKWSLEIVSAIISGSYLMGRLLHVLLGVKSS